MTIQEIVTRKMICDGCADEVMDHVARHLMYAMLPMGWIGVQQPYQSPEEPGVTLTQHLHFCRKCSLRVLGGQSNHSQLAITKG